MSWARIDDRANEHKKQLAAGTEACWLWACGLMYANRQEARDGFIPEQVLGMLYPFKAPARLAAKLVEVRLWHRVEGGYQIHDYHRINPTKEQVEAERKAGRDRAAKSYQKRAAKKDGSSGEEAALSSPEENTQKHVSSGLVWSGLDPTKDQGGGAGSFRSLDSREPFAMTHQWDPGPEVFMGTTVPPEAHGDLLPDFRAYWVARGDVRPGHQWRGSYTSWAVGEWRKRKAQLKTNPESCERPLALSESPEERQARLRAEFERGRVSA